jgi:hypothetical protein
MKGPIWLIFLFFAAFAGRAAATPSDSLPQPPRSPLQLGLKGHQGFIIPHSRELIDVSRSTPRGLELNLNWLLADEKHVREAGLIARRGFSAYFVHFDNPAVLGHSFALVPYVEPLFWPWKRLHAGLQFGLGAAYVSKVYDAQTNPSNLFFSLPVSLWAMFNARVYYDLHPHWQLALGFNHNHISNGGMKNPNKGMNFPTFNAGLHHNLAPLRLQRPAKDRSWREQPRNYRYVMAVGSVKNLNATVEFPETTPTLLYGAQAMFGRRIGRMSNLSVGMEWLFDGYAQALDGRAGLRRSPWKGAFMIGHELSVGRVRFHVHLCPYIFNPAGSDMDPLDDPLYQRYGLYYRFGRHLLVGSSLKTHRHVADVADVRVGWIW